MQKSNNNIPFYDYSGSPPVLLPESLAKHWHGFYMPSKPGREFPDLHTSVGNFDIHDNFDFDTPVTDYDRACSLDSDLSSVHSIPVGTGRALVFGTRFDSITWLQDKLILVNGCQLPSCNDFDDLQWNFELECEFSEEQCLLMNSCDHGANEEKKDYFLITIPLGKYKIEFSTCDKKEDSPAVCFWRFVKI